MNVEYELAVTEDDIEHILSTEIFDGMEEVESENEFLF